MSIELSLAQQGATIAEQLGGKSRRALPSAIAGLQERRRGERDDWRDGTGFPVTALPKDGMPPYKRETK